MTHEKSKTDKSQRAPGNLTLWFFFFELASVGLVMVVPFNTSEGEAPWWWRPVRIFQSLP